MRSQPARPYHHGDLRPALLRAAVEVIGHAGPAAMSLREVARRAGVTHAAAAYHFGDKAGLLTAVAAQGYRMLTEELRSARDARRGFLEVGVAYMRFAVSHRAHFEVMYQPELYRRDDAEVREARAAAAVLLYGTASPDTGQLAAGAAAWSLVHGLATLWLNGNLPPQLGDDPEEITRQVASYLSIPANPGAPPQRLPTEQADPRAAASMRLVAGDRTDSAFRVPARAEGLQPELTVRNGDPAAPGGAHAAARYDARWRAGAGTLAWVRVVITEIGWDGRIHRRALDTGSLTGPGRCESLLGQVLAIAPPYRAAPGRPVYVLHAGDRAVVVGEDNLIGLLRPLVTAVLAAGDLCLGTTRAGGGRPGTGRMTAPVILTGARPGYGKAVLVYRVTVCPGQPGVVR